jgi:saccharopine dehydrogenase-like NADP-dependent oxidoreductase
MKNIFVIGAGRSASSLIRYLLDHAGKNEWKVTIGDLSKELVESKVADHKNGEAVVFDIHNASQREKYIGAADLVISMLPATMHMDVAKDCLRLGKHMFTASYVSPAMQELNDEAKKKGLLFLNEIGLDPGIDHMSAMKIIDELKAKGIKLKGFYSWCGGLVAPESNDNPWGYKFTWNPRNVVLAGQGTARYIENGHYKYIPYNRIFTEIRRVDVEGHGTFEGYANRDSLSYRPIYGLEDIPTMLRGTLRMPGYCYAWDALIEIGLTDDTVKIEHSEKMTYAQLMDAFLPGKGKDVRKRAMDFLDIHVTSPVMERLEWLGIFSEKQVKVKNGTPAQILQELLEEKWALNPNDKDMIVMQHHFVYDEAGKEKNLYSSLVVKGDDMIYTAMAKTVGLPLAIAAKLMLQGKINMTGVVVPVMKEIYEPVLKELEKSGVTFTDHLD